jgi:hypothetical protein
MTRRLLPPLFLLVLLLPGLAQAVIRYVSAGGAGIPAGSDSNTCDQSKNINTPKFHLRGTDGAIACMAGGDTLHVRSGVYNEHMYMSPGFGGDIPNGLSSWATATTIAKYSGDTVRPIIRSPAGWTNEVLLLYDRAWIIIDGLELDMTNNPPGPGTSAVVAFIGPLPGNSHTGGHLRLINCDVHGGNHDIGGGGLDHQFINNIVRDSRSYGWYMPCVGCLWEGNDVYNIGGYGIHEYETTIPSGLDNNIIRNNRFHNWGMNGNTSFAIIMAHGNNNQAYNNLMYNGFSGIQFSYDCTDCKYYNNTIINNSNTGIELLNDHTADGFVRNNLVYNNHPNFYEGNQWNPANVVRQNNLCNTTAPEQTAVHCSHSGNPDFVDAGTGNLRLNGGSAARNQGIPVSVSTTPGASLTPLNTSFYGIARPQPSGGAYDIGAAEYNEGGSGSGTASGNPIYVAQIGGTPAADCTQAESQATPFRTIASGLACMTVPGKTMYIKAGTYSEVIDTGVTPITGGSGPSYTNATTFEAFGSDVVTIQVPVGGFLPLYLQNGSNDKYLVFRKLIFDSAHRADSNGPTFAGGTHHIRLENCEIKNSVYEGAYALNANNIELVQTSIHDTGAAGAALYGTIDGFVCQHCTIYDSAGGITWNVPGDTGTKSNIVIRESLLQNLTDTALDAGKSTGAVLQNSIVADNTSRGIWLRTGATGMKLYNNTIANNGGVGLQCDAGASSAEITNDISWNNTGGNMVLNCGITPTTSTYTVDPLFAPGTYELADASPAVDTGTNIPSLTVSYNDEDRRQGAQDQGAFERLGVTTPIDPGPAVTVRPPALFQSEMFF